MNKKTIIEMKNCGKPLLEIAETVSAHIHAMHQARHVSTDAGSAAIWREAAEMWQAAGLTEDDFWTLAPDVLTMDKDRFLKIKALATGPVKLTQGKRV